MAARLLRIAAVLAGSALALIGSLNLLEHVMLYHPHPYRENYHRLLSAGVVELQFKTNAGWQTAFYLRPGSATPATTAIGGLPDRIWVAFCGNGSLALDWLPLMTRDSNPRDAFLLIDYPGYGKSEGWSNIANTRAAAEGALAALAARLGTQTTTLEPLVNAIGHSLGAAVALDFARRHSQVRRVILLAPFTTLREEAATIIGTPLSYLLRENYDNRAALRQLGQRRPPPRVIVFHGLRDGLIPADMGRELAAEFPAFVSFRGMPEANHDTVVSVAEDGILALMAPDPKEGMAR